MADLEFSKSRGTLRAFGQVYQVRSGIDGKFDAVADGSYTIPPSALMVGTEKAPPAIYDEKYADNAYLDGNAFGWFLWIGIGNYGIHPDGNVPGTKGCIGLTAKNTRPIFNEFAARVDKSLTLIVGQTLPSDPKEPGPPPPIDDSLIGAPKGRSPGLYPCAPNWGSHFL